jgi:hypothetical protein
MDQSHPPSAHRSGVWYRQSPGCYLCLNFGSALTSNTSLRKIQAFDQILTQDCQSTSNLFLATEILAHSHQRSLCRHLAATPELGNKDQDLVSGSRSRRRGSASILRHLDQRTMKQGLVILVLFLTLVPACALVGWYIGKNLLQKQLDDYDRARLTADAINARRANQEGNGDNNA